jgi:hypothetical protein
MQKQSINWLIPVLLAVGAAVALWLYWLQVRPPKTEPATLPAVVAEPQVVPGPLHPVPEADLSTSEGTELVPLPPLDQSDAYFKLELANALDEGIDEWLVASGVIEKIVATVDSLPREHVAEKIRPITKIDAPFGVDNQDEGDNFTISPGNYDRYDVLVDMAVAADVSAMADLYRRFYPLFQSAYQNLGYPDGYFNDRLVEVIDHLLATPEPGNALELVQPNVMYEYADPAFENLSSGQKMLLRIGDEHRAEVKDVLRQARGLIAQMSQ